jgi:hypothetical protein
VIVQCPPLTTADDGDERRKQLRAEHGSPISHIAFVKALDAIAKEPSRVACDLATIVFEVLAVSSQKDRQVGLFSRPAQMKASASETDQPPKKSRYTKKDQGRIIEEAMTAIIGSRFGIAMSAVEERGLGWAHQAIDISGASPDLVLFNTSTMFPFAFLELGEGSVADVKKTQLFTYAVNALNHDCGNAPLTSENAAVNRAVLGMSIIFLADGTPKFVQLYGSCLMAQGEEDKYNKVSQVLLFQEELLSGGAGQLALARCFEALLQHAKADGYPTQSHMPHDRPANAALHDEVVFKWYPSDSQRTPTYMRQFLDARILELASGSRTALKNAVIVQYNYINGTHMPETIGHLVEIASQLREAHEDSVCHADVRGYNMIFAKLASASRLIDWDYAVKCGPDGMAKSCYPINYRQRIDDGGRDDRACGGEQIDLKHDLVGFCKFAEKFEPEEGQSKPVNPVKHVKTKKAQSVNAKSQWKQALSALTEESGLEKFINLLKEVNAVRLRCTDEEVEKLLSLSLPKVLEGTGSPRKSQGQEAQGGPVGSGVNQKRKRGSNISLPDPKCMRGSTAEDPKPKPRLKPKPKAKPKPKL